jgi:CRISPR system Cascade subunit CasC
LHNLGVKIAVRTVQLKNIIAETCMELGAPEEKAMKCGQVFANILLESNDEKKGKEKKGKEKEDTGENNAETEGKVKKENILFFFTNKEAKAFGEYARSLSFDETKISKSEIEKIGKKALTPAQDGLDIALFGRMVAKAPVMNMEAAASFSHAISTHQATSELDFFTALDDLQKDPGSAHMNNSEFNSATYYRYISLDLGQLYSNLFGEEPCKAERVKDMQTAVEAFTKALYLAIPAARQKTQSGASFWDYAHILVRKGQRLQASFEKPVPAKEYGYETTNIGYLVPSIKVLEEFLQKKEKEAGTLFQKKGEITFGEGIEETSIDGILSFLNEMLVKVGS